MRIVRTHNMTKEAAKNWVGNKLPTLIQQYGGNDSDSDSGCAWRDDTMEFSRRHSVGNVKVHFRVTDVDYILDVDLPFAARLIEGKARSTIERWFDENLPR